MAVSQIVTNSQLRLVFDKGLDPFGNAVLKSKSFNNVKTDASEEALYQVASGLASLQMHTLNKVERNNSYQIINM